MRCHTYRSRERVFMIIYSTCSYSLYVFLPWSRFFISKCWCEHQTSYCVFSKDFLCKLKHTCKKQIYPEELSSGKEKLFLSWKTRYVKRPLHNSNCCFVEQIHFQFCCEKYLVWFWFFITIIWVKLECIFYT